MPSQRVDTDSTGDVPFGFTTKTKKAPPFEGRFGFWDDDCGDAWKLSTFGRTFGKDVVVSRSAAVAANATAVVFLVHSPSHWDPVRGLADRSVWGEVDPEPVLVVRVETVDLEHQGDSLQLIVGVQIVFEQDISVFDVLDIRSG